LARKQYDYLDHLLPQFDMLFTRTFGDEVAAKMRRQVNNNLAILLDAE
jgi:hypothetical protein